MWQIVAQCTFPLRVQNVRYELPSSLTPREGGEYLRDVTLQFCPRIYEHDLIFKNFTPYWCEYPEMYESSQTFRWGTTLTKREAISESKKGTSLLFCKILEWRYIYPMFMWISTNFNPWVWISSVFIAVYSFLLAITEIDPFTWKKLNIGARCTEFWHENTTTWVAVLRYLFIQYWILLAVLK